jgi:hypothetical protein
MQPGERLGVRGKERGRRDNELNIGYSQYQFTNYLTCKRINIEGAKIRSWEELH